MKMNLSHFVFVLIAVIIVLFNKVKAVTPMQTLEKFYTADVNYTPRSGIPHQHGILGISTVARFTMLSNTPTLFKVRRPGLGNEANTVSFESIQKPGYYLRYKNYKFHMQKQDSTDLFGKDATFREKEGPRGRAYELMGRDNWFMCHSDSNPFTLQAKSERIGTREFESNCVYVPARQTFVQKKNIVKSAANGAATVIDQVPATQTTDKCIGVRFVNQLGGPVRVVSSMKPEGYLVTANAFKLKTIFKHANHKQRHVIFYAENVQDRDDDVLLNNKNVYTTKPSDCTEEFTDIVLTSAQETEHSDSKKEEPLNNMVNTATTAAPSVALPAPPAVPVADEPRPQPPATSDVTPTNAPVFDDIPQAVVTTTPERQQEDADQTTVAPQPTKPLINNEVKNLDDILRKKQGYNSEGSQAVPVDNEYSSWSSYGPCSQTCGVGVRRRTRICNPGMICTEPLTETRACIKEMCASDCTHTTGGNVRAGSCCSFPFTYNNVQYDNCILSPKNNERLWCSTTPSFDRDKQWGLCPQNAKPGNRLVPKPIIQAKTEDATIITQRREQQPRPSSTPPYDYRQENNSPYTSYYGNTGYYNQYKAYDQQNTTPCHPMCATTCVQQCPRRCCLATRSDMPITAYLGNNYGPTDRRNTIPSNWFSRNRRDLSAEHLYIEQYD